MEGWKRHKHDADEAEMCRIYLKRYKNLLEKSIMLNVTVPTGEEVPDTVEIVRTLA